MKGSATRLFGFMEGDDKRYIIPVYQRKYDWKIEHCSKLYEDLKKIICNKKSSHFFGSIVSQIVPDGSKIEYHIIDGQQRLTTVTLLLLAMSNLIEQGRVTSEEPNLNQQILHRFVISPWAKSDDKIKLRPVMGDVLALQKLFGPPEDYEYGSKITINYQFFYNQILKEDVSIDELYDAIRKLEIISITLDHDDDPQLIFESLNSTGLALQEGDKIRNYILMGMSPTDQEYYYNNYWTKIEKCSRNDVSGFVRDFLSIKTLVTPNINNVYQAFKKYVEEHEIAINNLLSELLKYARHYEKLLSCNSNLNSKKLDDCLYRLKRLEVTVTRPFFMEILRLNQDSKLSVDEVLNIFEITENYLFRRNICEVPTNALNKIFLNLNKEIYRYDNTINNYVDKFIYSLLSKKESGRFPDDNEFTEALSSKSVYLMRGKYKAYLFERIENFGTIEAKDVYTQLDNNVYTIEHIMPQHLSPGWVEALGPNAEGIHAQWLHRLANLTLTGYNPRLSNNPFIEKRDADDGGYKASGLRMNQKISTKDTWGLTELEERNAELLEYAKKIWSYPETGFVPAEKEFDSCTLDDEDIDLTGRDIVKYSYQNSEQPVKSWADMLEHLIKYLHQKDRAVLSSLAYNQSDNSDLTIYVNKGPSQLRSAIKVDDNIYFEKGTNTALKISILRKLFSLYELEPMDLVFYLRDTENDKIADEGRYELRKRYWTYALPIIQQAHCQRGSFSNAAPGTSNWCSGYFGVGGFSISCIANYNEVWVALWLSSGDASKNKKAFDLLYAHKDKIEHEIENYDLSWSRADQNKASWISYTLKGVSITNEEDWPRIARFQAEWSAKIANAMIPYLSEFGAEATIAPEKASKNKSLLNISLLAKEWAFEKAKHGLIMFDISQSNRTYIRFRTPLMDKFIPDAPNTKSGWNTANHYFYEVINDTGHSAYIQLSLSIKEMPQEQVKICNNIRECYPSEIIGSDMQWIIPFKTSSVNIEENATKETIYNLLNICYDELLAFETDLQTKLTCN